ncbi:MAG: type IV pilus twitching motility protein PilT [Elusimicrobia bacterium]|nr:type IV pilus twitching motility protein PilT [Elusimicrobiota bacterium]
MPAGQRGLNDLLKLAAERKASDVHLKVGAYPVLRIDGKLTPLQERERISREWMADTLYGIMSPNQKETFKKTTELDMAYSVPGLGRFRVNIYQQRGTMGAVLRVIPMKILTVRELGLPSIIERLALEPRGLILVTGTTGSGKSTTLAGMIDHINATRNCHIMTIEDPIEYLHRDKLSLVNQREVGGDTLSFAGALRASLRQDPDVILVGEMRDLETVSTALVAAETGHLVLSTLHTADAAETINRVLSVFPPHQQQQIRLQLATVLQGIISMRLIPRADGTGRVPAVEVLIATTIVRECIIAPERTKEITDIIAAGTSQYGTQTFDQALMDLYHRELITYEEALHQATNPDDFALKVRGIQSTEDMSAEAFGGGKPPAPTAPGGRAAAGPAEGPLKIDRFDRSR